ncbi:hypothetical protein FQN50_007514 [Emmonsiellopsis sp. PD_5]|nr:hypothetical protein FQN50_007514 [Emmonsiellopsis sp. PD_5]
MDLERDGDDPFALAVDRLWEPSYFSLQTLQPLDSLPWDDGFPDLAKGVFQSSLDLFNKKDSTIYELNLFGSDPLESIDADTTSASSCPSQTDAAPDIEQEPDQIPDVWTLEGISKPTTETITLRSWDTFPHHHARPALPIYLSEAGPRGYDAALSLRATESGLEDSGRVARTDIFIASLFRLGLGWNSIFFRYNEQTRVFQKDIMDARISGISLATLDGMIEEFLQCGTRVRKIRRFILTVPTSVDLPTPLSSLARAASVLLHSFEENLAELFKTGLSLLKTQMLFRRSGCLLQVLVEIIESAEDAKTDGAVISSVFMKCDHFAHQFIWLSSILHEMMALVAESWVSVVESWIGLRPEPQTLIELNRNEKGFIDTEYVEKQNGRIETQPVDYSFRPEAMPVFVPEGYAETIFESGKSLRLLRMFHPNHPLSRKRGTRQATPLSLNCAFTWQDIDEIQRKANDYEAQLRKEILRYNDRRPATNTNIYDDDNSDEDARLHNDEHTIDGAFSLFDIDAEKDGPEIIANRSSVSSHKLHTLLTESQCFNPERIPGHQPLFGPPLDASVHLSFDPVISAQTRLINFSCLHLLFKGHKIKDHLQLQWRFQLLGDGVFSSRLSHVLFDPEMHSGERKAGVVRGGSSTGLRLGNRDTWPPASSELRLVLMGLLSESYHSDKHHLRPNTPNQATGNKELPGGLSFAIRELTSEELLKCKNPNSIEALDFLRLQYHPPTVLEAIITPRSLRRYDHIFRRVLRQIRMLAVANALIRDSTDRASTNNMSRTTTQRFRTEAQHFVQAVSDYSFHIAVGDTWSKFEKTIMKIEKCIDKGDIDGTINHAKSLHRLREYHEDVLDQILFALFVSKRHAQARKLLDDIFGTILAFAPISKAAASGSWGGQKESYERIVKQLFALFRKQVSGFVKFLRGLDGVKAMRARGKHADLAAWGSGERSGGKLAGVETEVVFEHLLLRLDLNGFY